MSSVAHFIKRQGLWIEARWSHWYLDERLAAGFEPDGDPALAARAAQLRSPRHRRRLAASVERLADESAIARPRGMSSAVPIVREQVGEARESLLRLAAQLRSAELVHPRGVAMVERLLGDTESFVYTRCARGVVELQVQAALRALLVQAPHEKGAALSAAPLNSSVEPGLNRG